MTFEDYIRKTKDYKLFTEELDVSLTNVYHYDDLVVLVFYNNGKEGYGDYSIRFWKNDANFLWETIVENGICLTARTAYRLSEFLKFLDSINFTEVCNESY